MKRHLALAWILVGSVLALIPITVFLKASASNSKSRAAAPGLARLSDRATVHAAGRGVPRINLADGHEVLTAYEGDPEARRLLQQNLAQPLAIAASDFDEDGVPDLVTGYSAPNCGIVALHRGNVDSIHPNTLEAQQRRAGGTFTDAPFLSPARVFETPGPADFIGCGDFDADGKMDVVTATRGGLDLYFLRGDGHGNLAAARQIELCGAVTALVIGEINRPDGLADIVVAVSGTDTAKALVFQAAGGALRGDPDAFPLPAEATALVLGQLDGDYFRDLAIASGRGVTILRGRDHKAMAETKRTNVQAAVIDRRTFPFAIRSLVVGDFSGQKCDEVALLADDGAVHVLSRAGEVSRRRAGKSVRVQDWHDKTVPGAWPQARLLAGGRIGSLPTDNLVVIDSANRRLHILAEEPATRSKHKAVIRESLDVEGEPVAVLPMRLNADALSDLVILRRGQVAPSAVVTPAMMTFTVTTINDDGLGSLRQAITDSNTMAGADVINFNISVGGSQIINLAQELPTITEAVMIDGTTQPGFAGNPLIEVRGMVFSSGGTGLFVVAGNTTIKGLIINGFPLDGIVLQTAGNNVIEGNFIGIGSSGAAPNGGSGVFVDGTSGDRIGGTTSAARNVISGNSGAGVLIGNAASDTLVLGNFIGTDPSGAELLGNATGVVVDNAKANSIGGNSPGAGNLISANVGDGVLITTSSFDNLVRNNLIGTNVIGSGALANGGSGVEILSGSNNIVGGTSSGDPNTIAFNAQNGIQVQSGAGNTLRSNSIFGNGTSSGLGINLANDAVTPNDACDPDPGPNDLQNHPVLTSATSDGATTTITGTLNSVPGSTFTIEFFANNTCHPSGFGEGQTFIGSTSATTNASCIAPINVTLPVGVTTGELITATATNGSNSTSEFSQCVTVTAPQVSDLQITKSDSPDPVITGSNITYTMVVTNNGPDTDFGATFTDIVPTGTTFVSISSSGSCSSPPVGGTGTVSCSFVIAASSSTTITLVVQVTAPAGSTITNMAMISGSSSDPVPGNNSATASTAVVAAPGADLQITKSDSPDPVVSGSNITYTIVVMNNGPSSDTGATFTDIMPTGTTFVSITSPGSCSTPPVGGTGTVSCSLGALSPTQTVTITLVVKVSAAPGSTITNTASISGMSTDPVPGNNSATASTAACTLTCPPDLVATSPNIASCGAVVTYSPPASGACGTVNCAPPSGSLFAVGTTTVTCNAPGVSTSCSFSITVVDNLPPTVFCPASISTPATPGQSSAVVNYPAANVTDNCTEASVQCTPPSGTRFPIGTTVVTCTGTDSSSNSASCSFNITVLDSEVPVIKCPPNVNAAPPSGQSSAVVNYPAPTATDNLPGVNVVCIPASGTIFPAGTTTVTCTATDAGGNKSSCSFIVGVGGPQLQVTIAGNKAEVEFSRVGPARKAKPKNSPCSFFSVTNIGFAPLTLTLDSIVRTGSDVDSGRITDPNDAKYFIVNRIVGDLTLMPIDIGAVLTLPPGQGQSLCVRFTAFIPALAGKTTGLAASNVLPNSVTSSIVFRQNAGANIAVPLFARVDNRAIFIDPTNPRRPPFVTFTRSGNEITVSYAVYDSDLDVTFAKYEFLDANRQVVGDPFEVDLGEPVRALNLVKGQSFSVEQRFTGAIDNPQVTSVRVTVFDGRSSSASAPAIVTSSIQLLKQARGVTLYPQALKLNP